MKKLTTLAAVLALAAGGTFLQAQDQERPERERQRGQRDGQREGQRERPREGDSRPGGPRGFPNPLMTIFDTDNDGTLSATEIDKAADALRKLDRNEDGKVTAEELPRPAFGGFGGGAGAFGGGRPGGFNPGAFVDGLMEENDKDKDGALSKEEIEAIPERQRGMLLRSDTNEDGAVDKSELEQMRERIRNFGGGRRPGGERGEGGDRPERPRRPERPQQNNET